MATQPGSHPGDQPKMAGPRGRSWGVWMRLAAEESPRSSDQAAAALAPARSSSGGGGRDGARGHLRGRAGSAARGSLGVQALSAGTSWAGSRTWRRAPSSVGTPHTNADGHLLAGSVGLKPSRGTCVPCAACCVHMSVCHACLLCVVGGTSTDPEAGVLGEADLGHKTKVKLR